MKILIFGCKCTLGYPGAPGDGGSVYMLALEEGGMFPTSATVADRFELRSECYERDCPINPLALQGHIWAP